MTKRMLIDANLTYGFRTARETNPIYGRTVETNRIGASVTAFIPLRKFSNSLLSAFAGGEIFNEYANVDFYDSSLAMVMVGVLWRHNRQ